MLRILQLAISNDFVASEHDAIKSVFDLQKYYKNIADKSSIIADATDND